MVESLLHQLSELANPEALPLYAQLLSAIGWFYMVSIHVDPRNLFDTGGKI